MAAAYDNYDYPSYWKDREYEHEAEIIALKELLSKIPKINTILDIGAGYGRLTSVYIRRARHIVITDPSAKLLGMARKEFTGKNIKIIQSKVENLPKKIRRNSTDVVICIRVLHHIENIDEFIKVVKFILKKDGFLILEYANKRHLKSLVSEFFKGNFTFALDIFPKDIRSQESIDQNMISFKNYHPYFIEKILTENGFKIIEKRSVSNVRNRSIKNKYPLEFLLFIEKHLQKIWGQGSLGPSMFLLLKKSI